MIRLEKVTKTYREGGSLVEALRSVTLEIPAGQLVSVMGPSGSGKSTLLNIIGALDRPTQGVVSLEGTSYASMSDDELTLLRRRRIGFVFQFFNLMPTMTVEENVLLPALLDGRPSKDTVARAHELAGHMGLTSRLRHRPSELSGGEMQRVAIARALVTQPPVILADEPTGNLDRKTGRDILEILRREARACQATLVMVTHDPEAATIADRRVTLSDGEIMSDV